MSDIALYRKYRPRTFDDVLGQNHVVKVLKEAIARGNIAHAYLFAGSRGTGKTSVARILAREIKTAPEDIYEIDAASQTSVDDIRNLNESVSTLPFVSPYKVYILDEVHMLSKSAFNALLKTLEEPPQHVVFVLATTELEKVPETVVSRCENYTFKKPNRALLKSMVTHIAKAEGWTLESGAADLIALLAEGSFRDAQGTLQKIISASEDKKVSREEVEQVTGAPSHVLVNDMLQAVAKRDAGRGLTAVQSAMSKNIDMQVFLDLVLEKVRAVLLLRFAKDLHAELQEEYSEEDFALLVELAKNKEAYISAAVLETLLEARGNMRYAHLPHVPLELALIKLTDNQQLTTDNE